MCDAEPVKQPRKRSRAPRRYRNKSVAGALALHTSLGKVPRRRQRVKEPCAEPCPKHSASGRRRRSYPLFEFLDKVESGEAPPEFRKTS
jgi:hypothetical protein